MKKDNTRPTASFAGDQKLKGKEDEKRVAALTPTFPPLGAQRSKKLHPAAR
jgi:hypothetical protein